MAIVIKEIHVKTVVEPSKNHTTVISEELLRRIKREVIKEIQQIQKRKQEWDNER